MLSSMLSRLSVLLKPTVRRFFAGGVTLGVSFVLALGPLPLMSFQALADDPPTTARPSDPRRGPVTSRDQLGRLNQGTVILCPGQSYVLNLYYGFNQRQIANTAVESGDPSIAGTQVFTSAQNHPSVRITAGENETNDDKITQVTVAVDIPGVDASIPKPKAGEKVNLRDILSAYSDAKTLTVRVLPKKKCEQLPPPAEKPKAKIGQDPTHVAVSPRSIKICVHGNRVLDMEREIRTNGRYERRRTSPTGNLYDPEQIPPLTGMRLIANSNPAVVGVQLFSRPGGPVKVQFSGLAEGTSTVTLSEHPNPTNVPPLQDTFNVEVKICSEKERENQNSWNGIGHGFELLPFSELPVQDRTFEEECFPEETPENTGEQPSTGEKKKADKPKMDKPKGGTTTKPKKDGKVSMGESFKTVESGALVSMVTFVDDTQLEVTCPNDAQAGEMITCSVLSEDPVKVDPNDYQVTVQSTQVVTDTSAKETMQRISMALPAGVLEPLMVLKDKATGEAVCHGTLPVSPKVAVPPPSAETPSVLFPKATHVGEPVTFKGNFTQPVEETAVKIGEQPAEVLAKSPRTMVVDNPAGTTMIGPQEVVVTQGEQVTRGPVAMLPPRPEGFGQPVDPNILANLPSPSAMEASLSPACRSEIEGYKARLMTRVDNDWHPPKPPHKGTWTAKLNYNLMRNLSVQAVQVVQPSGFPPVDQSAMQRVYQLQGQFEPLPQCYDKPYLPIEHTFRILYH